MLSDYTIKAAAGVCGCSYDTFVAWEATGFAPRRAKLPGWRRARITRAELEAWLAQRDRDRARLDKPHLRRPLVPGSWFPEAESRAGTPLPLVGATGMRGTRRGQ